MKRTLLVLLAMVTASGCASTVTKSFTVIAEPPDAEITVISGRDLVDQKYASPAQITLNVPKDPRAAAKERIEIKKEAHKSTVIAIRGIRDGDVIKVKLDKIIRYQITCRMISPVKSDELSFRDKIASISFTVEEKAVQMRFENLTPHVAKILWDRALFSDTDAQQHRLMHSGVRYQDRRNPIPAQSVAPMGIVQQKIMPVDKVVYSQQKKEYDVLPIFQTDNERAPDLKGRSFSMFIPVEVDRQIIPYNFRMEIIEVIRQ